MNTRCALASFTLASAMACSATAHAQDAAKAIAGMNDVQLALTLSTAAETTARKVPLTIDRYTVLTATSYDVKDKAMVFRYEVSAGVDKEALKSRAIRANCASPRLSAMFDRGVRARHVFTTSGGLLEVDVAQADCKQLASQPAPSSAPKDKPSAPAAPAPAGTSSI